MRNVLRIIAPAAVIITGLATATIPAIPVYAGSATTAHLVMKAQPAISGPICLTNSKPKVCIESNGAGNQVKITSNSPDWSNFTLVAVVRCADGHVCYGWANGNGNCLRAGTGNVVKIENGGCNTLDGADMWEGQSNGQLKSEDYGNHMLTRGEASGDNVFHENIVSGDWTNWTTP